jgi:hypothetical protein
MGNLAISFFSIPQVSFRPQSVSMPRRAVAGTEVSSVAAHIDPICNAVCRR